MSERGLLTGKYLPALIAIIAGALVPLSFLPTAFWPAGILALCGLSASLAGSTPAQAALRGWLFGVGMFGAGTSWVYVSIATYGNVSTFLALLITAGFVLGLALFIALPCWLMQRFFSGSSPATASPLVFAAMWVLGEWLRTWIFTGFPWLFAGYAHLHTPLAEFAPLFGVMGISLVVALTGSSLHALLLLVLRSSAKPAPMLRVIAAPALCWIGALALQLSGVRWVEPDGETMSVAVVHGTVPQEEKFDPLLDLEIVSRYDLQSEPLWGNDLVLWPETAIPLYYHRAREVLDYLHDEAGSAGSTLVSGIFHRGENGDVHNSIISLGEQETLYHKQRLVPFGEYTPLASVIGPVLQLFALPMSDIRPGPPHQGNLTAGGKQIGPSICYEVVYPSIVRERARNADVLVTISNDIWFGESWGPRQHLEMAAMRALENGRYMLRATNFGLSAIIDERGNIVAQTTQSGEGQTLTGEAVLFDGRTPWALWGNWPLLLFCMACLLFQSALLLHRRA